MSNPFKAIRNFFQHVISFVISPKGREKIAKSLEQAQAMLTPALYACEMIASLTEGRTDDQIIAVAEKYSLGTITPDMIKNDAIISGILKHAAMIELQHLTGSTADPRILDLAIQSAYIVYKQAAHDVKEAQGNPVAVDMVEDGTGEH